MRPGQAGIVVVTGGGRGQGAECARRLAADGVRTIALDVTAGPTEDLPGIEYRRLDVTDGRAWAELATDLAPGPPVTGLVANAGVTWRARVPDLAPADLARVHEVNVIGTLRAVQALTPLMTGGGAVVVIGSVAALTGHYAAAYTASKWALRGLAKAAALELGPRGIRVNTIHPGFIATPMTAGAPPAFRESQLAETPLGRLGTVADVAPLVAFLLSDDAAYITGAEIPVDGGASAHGGVKSISDALRAPA